MNCFRFLYQVKKLNDNENLRGRGSSLEHCRGVFIKCPGTLRENLTIALSHLLQEVNAERTMFTFAYPDNSVTAIIAWHGHNSIARKRNISRTLSLRFTTKSSSLIRMCTVAFFKIIFNLSQLPRCETYNYILHTYLISFLPNPHFPNN